MLAKKIDSLQHPLVKRWVKLREEKSFREENGSVLIVGEKMIKELPIEILISEHSSTRLQAKEHYIVSKDILKKITGLKEPDGFAAEIKLPLPQDLKDKKCLLILDRIADPGNLGTLLRTSLALNWDGVIFTPSTVDPFNDKALRAAKGATFRLPFAHMGYDQLISFLKNFHTYLADTDGTILSKARIASPLALILSNEAAGARFWPNATKLTIPMNQAVESLNVASSGAILLYAMREAL